MTKSPPLQNSRITRVPADLLRQCMREGMSERCIAAKLRAVGYRVSKTTVHRKLSSLRQGSSAAPKFRNQRPSKVTSRTKRYLNRLIRVHGIRTTSKLHAEVQQHTHTLSKRSVLRALQSMKTLQFKRPQRRCLLTVVLRRRRVQWVRDCLDENINWRQALFADEKVWYIDGPDRRAQVWQDVRDPPQIIPRTGARNQSVRVWGAVSVDFVPDLICLPATFNSTAYCDVLAKVMVTQQVKQQHILFHDRHPVHTSAQTERWLRENGIRVTLLPAKTADITPIENLWAYLSRKVFPQNKIYNSVDTLLQAIRAAWREVQVNEALRVALADSMPHRLDEVLAAGGGWTKH